MDRATVVKGVREQATWWLDERLKKIASESHSSMEVNPFLSPLVAALHGHSNFDELSEFLLGGHFSIGHATGFGKLVDEKILPKVFKSKKLDGATRKGSVLATAPFDNIDHIILKKGKNVLLSLKASKWTIQLGQAVELNKSFQALIAQRDKGGFPFENIVIATFYGKEADLTDKYRIVRGINTGKAHDVGDIRSTVSVLAGRDFWTWIGDGEVGTQGWVLEGISEAIKDRGDALRNARKQLAAYKASFSKRFAAAIAKDGSIDWAKLLEQINGS